MKTDLRDCWWLQCYGAVSIWSEATLQAGVEAPPSRTLDYKGPLLGLCVSMGGAFVGAGCQDGTMHVWKIAEKDLVAICIQNDEFCI